MPSRTPSHVKLDHDHQRLVVSDIASIFRQRRVGRLRSRDLLADLSKLVGRPWSGMECNAQGARRLARLLAPIRIRPKTIRFGAATAKGYSREWFDHRHGLRCQMTPNEVVGSTAAQIDPRN
jgi:hypothetical protein